MKIKRLKFNDWFAGMNYIEENMQLSREGNSSFAISKELNSKMRQLESLIKNREWTYDCLLTVLNQKFYETQTELIHHKSSEWFRGLELFIEADSYPLYFNLWNNNNEAGLSIDYIGTKYKEEVYIKFLTELLTKTNNFLEEEVYKQLYRPH